MIRRCVWQIATGRGNGAKPRSVILCHKRFGMCMCALEETKVPRVIWECLGDITVRARFVQVTTVADLRRCMRLWLRRETGMQSEKTRLASVADARYTAEGLPCSGGV